MSVTVKFQVTSIASSLGFEGVRVQLAPLPTLEAGENMSLFKGTPQGLIELYITTASGANFFEIGKRYLVDIKPE